MEILNAGKKDTCIPVTRLSNEQVISEPALPSAGITSFNGTTNLTAGTDRIMVINVAYGVRDTETPINLTSIDVGGITPTPITNKTITSTGAGVNGQNTQETYYILESDIASLTNPATITVNFDMGLQNSLFGGVQVRTDFYENVNQGSPIFATNQNCIAGVVTNPHSITVPSSEFGATHWVYTKAAGINDSWNSPPNTMDVGNQVSGLFLNTGYQEGDLTDPHELEITQLAGTFKGVIATGINLFNNCIELPEPQCNCEITTNTELVDRSYIVDTLTAGDANETGELHTLTVTRVDSAFTTTATGIVTAIPLDHVDIHVNEWYQPSATSNTALQRIAPVLELLKNGNVVATSATGYQRHANDHSESSNGLSWIDSAPLVGDVYEVQSRQESTQNDILNITLGHLQAKGVEKVPVVVDVTIN